MAKLFTAASTRVWMTEHEVAYNSLDQEIIIAKLKAKSLCCKIHAGNIPWTPELTQAIQWILYWKGMMNRMQGSAISTMVLKQWAGKGQISFKDEHQMLLLDDLKKKADAAYLDYFQIKTQMDNCNTWLGQLIAAQA